MENTTNSWTKKDKHKRRRPNILLFKMRLQVNTRAKVYSLQSEASEALALLIEGWDGGIEIHKCLTLTETTVHLLETLLP